MLIVIVCCWLLLSSYAWFVTEGIPMSALPPQEGQNLHRGEVPDS